MTATTRRTVNLLLAEDNPADVRLFKEALAAAELAVTVHVVGDGRSAIRFLRRQEPYGAAPRPDVIALDLRMPLKNGDEVLTELASDPDLSAIPVAILTSSLVDTDVCDIYPAGRCLYFSKTGDFRKLQHIVRWVVAHASAPSRLASR